MIVMMGIDTQMRDFAFAVGDCFCKNPFFCAVSGDSVDRAVGGVGEPGAVFDMAVGCILTDDKGKNAIDHTGIFTEIEPAFSDVPKENLSPRIAVCPLPRVAGSFHKSAGVFIDS